jgi:hypothetical protein
MSESGLVSRVAPVQPAMRNCTRDEGRSFEVGNQALISSHSKTAPLFDHLVGSYLQSQWNCKPKCFGSFEVYKNLKSGRLQDR